MPTHTILPSDTDDVFSVFTCRGTAYITPIRLDTPPVQTGFTIRNPRLGKPRRVGGSCRTGFTVTDAVLEGGTPPPPHLWR